MTALSCADEEGGVMFCWMVCGKHARAKAWSSSSRSASLDRVEREQEEA